MQDQTTLAYLMCSKFCHDLAAPLGAISLGLEMLPEAYDPDSPQKILEYSVRSAINKLELLRCIASNAVSSEKLTLTEAVKTINKSIDNEKIKIDWQCPVNESIKGDAVRLLTILILLSIDALPKGGYITITPDFSIEVAGDYVKFNDEVINMLINKKTEDPSSRTVLAYLAALLSKSLETEIIIVAHHPNKVVFRFE